MDAHAARPWRQRLSRALAFPTPAKGEEFLREVALPALGEVAVELRSQGVDADATRVEDDGAAYVQLMADAEGAHPFRYVIYPRECTVPSYGDRDPQHEVYVRLEVHLTEGGQGYDVMGYTHTQLIDDVLDQYERHLEFLRLQDEQGTLA